MQVGSAVFASDLFAFVVPDGKLFAFHGCRILSLAIDEIVDVFSSSMVSLAFPLLFSLPVFVGSTGSG